MHDRRRGYPGTRLRAHGIEPAQYARVPMAVRSQVTIKLRLIRQQLRHYLVQFRYCMGFVKTKFSPCQLRAMAKTLPRLALGVAFATKKNMSRRCAGDDDQHCFRFRESGQVIKIAVIAVGVVRVAITYLLGRGRQHDHTLLYGLRQPAAPLRVVGRHVNGVVGVGHEQIISSNEKGKSRCRKFAVKIDQPLRCSDIAPTTLIVFATDTVQLDLSA